MAGGLDIKDFPPNTNPELFSAIGAIAGLVIEADFNSYELNSIGNWLILVGQILLTTAAQQQLINQRYCQDPGSNIKSHANCHERANPIKANKVDMDKIIEVIKKLEDEIELLKNNP